MINFLPVRHHILWLMDFWILDLKKGGKTFLNKNWDFCPVFEWFFVIFFLLELIQVEFSCDAVKEEAL